MIKSGISNKLELAVLEVSERLNTIKPGITWLYLSEHFLWHELIACLLGSRVSFEHAQAAAHYLKTIGLLDVFSYLKNTKQFEVDIIKALSNPICPPRAKSGNGCKYRYPKLRANHIRRTAELIYQTGNSIKALLYSSKDARDSRIKIMSSAVGIGPKQSSLFLRNIGYANDLAILDRHVLQYMSLQDLLPTIPIVLTKIKAYIDVEDILRNYAEGVRIELSHLDTAIWVVMRIFQKEFSQCVW